MAGLSSQGTTFTFNGSTFASTSVRYVGGAERSTVSAPHMGMGRDDFEPTYITHRTADERPNVEVEFISGTPPAVGAVGAISVAGAFSFAGAVATCVSVQVTASVGDLVRGSASFRVQA
jgi:hypothetical protein